MCFSAQASFAASIGLLSIGILAFKISRTQLQRTAALTPLFFAIQQAIEGFLWILLPTTPMGTSITLLPYAYLFFAFIFWPTWIPATLYYYEPNQQKKLIISLCLGAGLLYAAYLIYQLITHGARVAIIEHHIRYFVSTPPEYYYELTALYWYAAAFPMFISSLQYLWVIGLTTSLTIPLSYYFYYCCFTSTWCFFAAIISGLILGIIWINNKK